METATDLIKYLWRGGSWGFIWVKPPKISYWRPASDIPEHFKAIERDVYFGIHPVTTIPPRNSNGEEKQPEAVRSQLSYIAAINCLFADVDGAHCGGKAEALTRVRLMTPPASVVIDSGGGYHCYWLLDNPLILDTSDTHEYARNLQRRWVKYIGGDPSARDLTRSLRVPGTYNCKPEYGLPHPLVHFERILNVSYSLHCLTGVLPVEKTTTRRAVITTTDSGVLKRQAALVAASNAGSRNSELNRASYIVHFAIENGMIDRGTAEDVLLQAALEAGLPEHEALRTIMSGFNAK